MNRSPTCLATAPSLHSASARLVPAVAARSRSCAQRFGPIGTNATCRSQLRKDWPKTRAKLNQIGFANPLKTLCYSMSRFDVVSQANSLLLLDYL
jgi:hypothetical protein